MIEFIDFTEGKRGIKFRTKFNRERKITLMVGDGYSPLNLWRDTMVVKEGEFFFESDIFSKEREFKILSEVGEILVKIPISVDGFKSIEEEDKYGILPTYKYEEGTERGVGLPIFEIFLNKTYEREDFQINPGDTVFDIGGNIGFFSYYAVCREAGEVHVFEPGARQFKAIEENICKRFKNVFASNLAVGKETGYLNFYLDPESSVRNSTTSKIGEFIKVPSIHLEDYCRKKEIKKINFLKIDCEGGEYDIIDSCSEKFISSTIDKISLEVHESEKTPALFEKLRRCGFIKVGLDDSKWINFLSKV